MKSLVVALALSVMPLLAAAQATVDGKWVQLVDGKPDRSSAVTFKTTGQTFSMSSSSGGSSYEVTLGGAEAPLRGEPDATVSVTMPSPGVMVEESRKGGKPWLTMRMEVSADGKTAKVRWTNLQQGASGSFDLVRD